MEERKKKTYELMKLTEEQIEKSEALAAKTFGEIKASVVDCIKNRKPGLPYIPIDMHLMKFSVLTLETVEKRLERWEKSWRKSSKLHHQLWIVRTLRMFNATHTCSECDMKHCILQTTQGFLESMRKMEISALTELEDEGIRRIMFNMLTSYILALMRLIDAYEKALETFTPEELQKAHKEASQKIADKFVHNIAKQKAENKISEEKEKELVMLYG